MALVAALLTGCSGGTVGTVPAPAHASPSYTRVLRSPLGAHSIVPGSGAAARALCPPSRDARRATCFATVRMASSTTGAFPDSVDGLTPNDLSLLYNFSPAQATNQVVGIVIAFDAPNAEADLGVYRAFFGLPPCTTVNGCFTKIFAPSAASESNASGTPESVSPHPTTVAGGWPDEGDVDLEMISASCPNCSIVLSEAASDGIDDLGQAVAAAVQQGATVVNASFGAPEDGGQTSVESAFEPAPVKVLAAAGDSGPGAYFPASARNVIAVAGTTIDVSGQQVTESLWSGSGGGCSSVFSRPHAQPRLCANRMRSVADVAAVADPNTGVAFYDSNLGGWGMVGGTSVATPIVAGMFALSGDTANGYGAQDLYQNSAANQNAFYSVQNGGTIAGLGVPNGLSGF